MVLGFVQRIGNARPLSLKQHPVVSRRTQNTANNRGEEGNNEIVIGCREHLPAIDDSREQSRPKVSSWVNGLASLVRLPNVISG
jgi:hypothetical protein